MTQNVFANNSRKKNWLADWFVVCGLWFVVGGWWLVVCGCGFRFTVCVFLWFVVRGSWFVVRGLWLVGVAISAHANIHFQIDSKTGLQKIHFSCFFLGVDR